MADVSPQLETFIRILITSMLVISAIMLLFNIFTCMIFFSAANRNSRPKLLLGNIAIADSLLIITIFLELSCPDPIRLYFQKVFDCVSIFIMPVISIDRYFKFVHPLNSNPVDSISNKRLMSLIFLIAVLTALPYLIAIDMYHMDSNSLTLKCSIYNTSELITNTFPFIVTIKFTIAMRLLSFLVEYLLPLVTTSYFCIRIICHIIRQKWSQELNLINVNRKKSAFKIIKLLIAVMVIFTVSHSVFFAMNVMVISVNDINGNLETCPTFTPMFTLVQIIFLTSALCNPLIYYALSKTYRRDALYLLKCIKELKFREFFLQNRRRSSSASVDIIRA